MDEEIIKVNVLELASDLAHKAAMDEMIGNLIIDDEDEMWDYTAMDSVVYTDQAQDVFNRHYDYFETRIRDAQVHSRQN